VSAADRAIRASANVAVLGVAGIAAYISYWHAYEVISAHGESGVTARLEPATIDGLVYCSSMVVLCAARHQLPVPRLARCLLGLGIMATLAANLAHGWCHGPIGATVAAWPAASLVGSYELLLWLIRTAGASAEARVPLPDQAHVAADRHAAELRLVTTPSADPHTVVGASVNHLMPDGFASSAGLPSGPERPAMGGAYQFADHSPAHRGPVVGQPAGPGATEEKLNAAAVAAYRASLDNGKPISERRLAAMFGKTSRRWARHRMAEARRASLTVAADTA
jgi:Protein of unknown function (DUF2637)